MLSQSKNRVQAIKNKFENLSCENESLVPKRKHSEHVSKHSIEKACKNATNAGKGIYNKLESAKENKFLESDSDEEYKPNSSFLYDTKHLCDSKKPLVRQSSDPNKRLQRSHAFRCDRSQKIGESPKKSIGKAYSDSEEKSCEKNLSRERLKKLGVKLEDHMKSKSFLYRNGTDNPALTDDNQKMPLKSLPDKEVPKHILDQYAKVLKPKKLPDKQEVMTDSGVSSETENLDDEKFKPKKTEIATLPLPQEPLGTETLKLEQKNPHIQLTDTLKKALKQPLPAGPPPKKPPRTFVAPIPESPEKNKKDTRHMLQKLEQVLQKRERRNSEKNHYDTAEADLTIGKPREMHYLCTELLSISSQSKAKDKLKNCLPSLNCAMVPNQSMTSLPYRLSSGSDRDSLTLCCSCPKLSTFHRHSGEFKYCKEHDISPLKEHIYDIPFGAKSDKMADSSGREVQTMKLRSRASGRCYGVVNSAMRIQSKSLEDLRTDISEDQKLYDVPSSRSRSPSPAKTDFEKLRSTFEQHDKAQPKPRISEGTPDVGRVLVSKENLAQQTELKTAKPASLMRDSSQLDVDKENLNRLMVEIYDTVTAACRMNEQRPSRFPTDSDTNSEESAKLTRSLTEKRKNYVRRVSSRAAYVDPKTARRRFRNQTSVCSYKSEVLDNPYSTFRSWKSFRTSQGNISKMAVDVSVTDVSVTDVSVTDAGGAPVSMDSVSMDGKAGCGDIEVPFKKERGLFDVCLLVGLNHANRQPYIKSVFPSQVKVPPHIENLVFPETLTAVTDDSNLEEELSASRTQTYSLVLTDEQGERNYGYCRRVLPEGASVCLPLCYCVIGRYRAPGFYYKVLKEIESHHGSSEQEIHSILTQLSEARFPSPGEQILLTTPKLTDESKYKTLPSMRRDAPAPERPKSVFLSVDGARRCVKRALEPRVDEDNLSVLLDTLGAGLLIKVFGSLLLERKVILLGDNLSVLSSCIEALQSILYPFVWQQPLISTIPSELRAQMLEAPLPILAGGLGAGDLESVAFEEGMLIDISLTPPKLLFYQGDESTILPTICYKTLKTTIQMETARNSDHKDAKTRNVLISEAFLRFFVEILADFSSHFRVGSPGEGDLARGDVVFEKDSFVRNASSKQHQYFLEWFSETAMFQHFVQNMSLAHRRRQEMVPLPVDYSTIEGIVDAPLPNFYELFDDRVTRSAKKTARPLDGALKTNYKSAVNRKVKLLKNKLRDLIT